MLLLPVLQALRVEAEDQLRWTQQQVQFLSRELEEAQVGGWAGRVRAGRCWLAGVAGGCSA